MIRFPFIIQSSIFYRPGGGGGGLLPDPEYDPVVADLEGGGGGGLDLTGAADEDPVVAAGSPLGHCLGIGISV